MVRSLPNPRTWLPADFVTDSLLNAEIRDALKYLLDPPRAELRQVATQNLTTAVWTDITYTTGEDYDQADDPGHDTVTNTARYTAPVSAWYEISGCVALAVMASSAALVRAAVNGTAVNNSRTSVPFISGGQTCPPLARLSVYLNAGDFVTMQARQDTGGTIATSISADLGCRFSVRLIGK